MKLINIFVILYLIILLVSQNTNSEQFDNTNINTNTTDQTKPIDYSIKQIIPQININPNADIAIVYVYTQNIYEYCQHSIKNLTAYVKKYNYGLIVYSEPFNTNVSACWNKVCAILENLLTHKYLVWFDADAIINNFDISLDSFVKKYPDAEIICCLDILAEKDCVNSGVMIIKNTPWAYNIFKKTWLTEIPHKHNDQNVIFHTIVEDLIPNPDQKTLKYNPYCLKVNDPKFKLLEENAFNSNILHYKPRDFVIHLMGSSKEARIKIMRQINTSLGLDNCEEKDCVDLINNENTLDKVKKIKEICLLKK